MSEKKQRRIKSKADSVVNAGAAVTVTEIASVPMVAAVTVTEIASVPPAAPEFNYDGYKPDEIPLIKEFIDTLTPDEKKAMFIAADHLGTSFDIVRCNHFQAFMKTKTKK